MVTEDQSQSSPLLKGLVLSGGESLRMGFDKGLMNYHGLSHREYLYHLLLPFTTETYISCRPGQIRDEDIPILEDQFPDLGPFGAMLTAFHFDPNAAWLVVACDFPLIDHAGIEQLVQNRDTSSVATSFLDPNTLMPEPWITILEPRIFPILEDYHSKGRSSLRGVLVDYDSTLIRPEHPDILLNANTQEEAEAIKRKIGN